MLNAEPKHAPPSGCRPAAGSRAAAGGRGGAAGAAVILVALAAPAGSQEDLDVRVKAALQGFPGTAGICARNLDSGASYELSADTRVRAASTIKLAILVEAYAEVAEGRARFDDVLVLTEAKKAAGAGVLPELGEGLKLSLRDAVRLMIVVSDNTATNLVLDQLGADAVNTRMEALGLHETRCLRKVGGGGASGASALAANEGFGIGVTTPREMVALLEKLERGEVVSPLASREMLSLLKRQQYRDGIFRNMPGAVAATKPGALDHLRSDVGVLYAEGGRVAMAITLAELPEVDYTVDNPGLLLLSRLSVLLTDGLAAHP